MRDLKRSRITIVCETCEVSVVLSTRELAADAETDAFTATHELHRITMRLDFDPPAATPAAS